MGKNRSDAYYRGYFACWVDIPIAECKKLEGETQEERRDFWDGWNDVFEEAE